MTGEQDSALRIIDANLNRTAEGLRVIEDIARLVLNDPAVSAELKAVRHVLVQTGTAFQLQLVRSRDAAADVGRDTEVAGETGVRDLHSVLVANSRRVQESLRVLEEMAKLSGVSDSLSSEKFKQARFRLYTVEKEMLASLSERDKASRNAG
jgi:thiamine-phosphate pyrophosphorylase